MTHVKICGIKEPEHALTAVRAGADFIGMVFAESRRKVSIEQARAIVEAIRSSDSGTPLPDSTKTPEHGDSLLEGMLELRRPLTVGVFANNPLDEVLQVVEETGIDIVQFSGNEPWDMCSMVPVPAIRVLHVGPGDSAPELLARMEAAVEAAAILLDKADARAFGGTGQVLDWAIAAEVQARRPIWLAGGLTPANVPEAVTAVRPWAVDVSSGVEVDGRKSSEQIIAFLEAVRSTNA